MNKNQCSLHSPIWEPGKLPFSQVYPRRFNLSSIPGLRPRSMPALSACFTLAPPEFAPWDALEKHAFPHNVTLTKQKEQLTP